MRSGIILFLLVFSFSTYGQFKDDQKPVNVREGIVQSEYSSLYLGFINPNNFSMNHSVSMSYSASRFANFALGMYTNTMSYKFADNFNIQADISFVNSPYSSLGDQFTKEINGVYLDRVQLNYQPSENTNITLQFNQYPFSSYYGSRNYSPFWGY